MKLVFLLEPMDKFEPGDTFFNLRTEKMEKVTFPDHVPTNYRLAIADPRPHIREASNEDLATHLTEQKWLVFEDQNEMLDYIRDLDEGDQRKLLSALDKPAIVKYVSYELDMEIHEDADSAIEDLAERELLPEPDGSAGASFWKSECKDLIELLVKRHGWDFVYNQLSPFDPMQVNQTVKL